METLYSAWEWAKADWQHDWECGNTAIGFVVGVILIPIVLYLRNPKIFVTEFMEGYRGEV